MLGGMPCLFDHAKVDDGPGATRGKSTDSRNRPTAPAAPCAIGRSLRPSWLEHIGCRWVRVRFILVALRGAALAALVAGKAVTEPCFRDRLDARPDWDEAPLSPF